MKIVASAAPHTRAAFFGNRIQHRLDIRRRAGDHAQISLVAVCCSNDSLSSWNNRTFSMAITAWSAKVSSSLICAGVKGRTSHATCAQLVQRVPPVDEAERARLGASRCR